MALFKKTPAHVSTNAPPHWPRLTADKWSIDAPEVNYLVLGAELLRAGEASGTDLDITYYKGLLYEDGIVTLPLVVEEKGQQTAVFAYGAANANASAHYSGMRALLRQREQINACYYAIGALSPTKSSNVIERLDTPHFHPTEQERPDAEYALWWPTPEDPRLADSPALSYLDRWFETLDGYDWLLFTSFVKTLELVEFEEDQLFALPEQAMMEQVDGPGDLKLYLHASKGEGLWTAFHIKDTSASDRNLLLKHLADLGAGHRKLIEEKDADGLAADKGRALGFWRTARDEALRKEANGESDLRVGYIVESGSARWRAPGASSAAERKEASARLDYSTSSGGSGDLGDFVFDQLDYALETVVEAEPHTQNGEPNEPNLHPFVAIRKGDNVYRTTLHFFTEQEVIQTCPGIIREHGDVDMVAIVWDGIVRQGEERSDAILAQAQAKGDAECRFFGQRYRPPHGGQPAAALGNSFMSGTAPSLLPPVSREEPPPPPSDELRRFVQEVVGTTLKWIAIGDPSGMNLYQEGMTLFSPNLELDVGDKTLSNRFVFGNLLWATGASRKVITENKMSRKAVLVYDDVTTLNGKDARSLRFQASEPGAPCSWIFVQAYETPQGGKPFTIKGSLELLSHAEPLFPSGFRPVTPRQLVPPTSQAPPTPEAAGTEDPNQKRRHMEMTASEHRRVDTAAVPVTQRRGPMARAAQRFVQRDEQDPVDLIRFTSHRCEIDDDGIRASYRDGSQRSLQWVDVGEIVVRQLPTHEPWDSALLLDLVPKPGSEELGVPIRILTTTFINFSALPGGAATARQENYRKLASMICERSPETKLETETRAFVVDRKPCTRFLGMEQFSRYDARYG
jgi:hypothetical protein